MFILLSYVENFKFGIIVVCMYVEMKSLIVSTVVTIKFLNIYYDI